MKNAKKRKPTLAEIRAAIEDDNRKTELRRIRQLLAKPMIERMNFLRVKIGKGSAL